MAIIFRKSDSTNKWLLVLLGFFIPISTALTNIALGFIILFWMLDNISDRFQRWIWVLKSNPVAFMGLIVFLIHVVGIFYSNGENRKIAESLNDGAKFLFISMAMMYFKDEEVRYKFLFSFVLAMSVTLALSYLMMMKLLPGFVPVKGGPSDYCIFHDHIKQNVFMAYMSFLAAVWARDENREYWKRMLWAGLSFLALFNVFFMVAGRTGHLVLGVLYLYYFVSWRRAKSLVIAGLVLLFIGISAWVMPSNPFFLRAKTAIEEIRSWEYGKKANADSSSGLRFEFYTNTLKIIKENPVFGSGTGSFENAYQSFTKDKDMNPTNNPHNDYLMITFQFGFIGLFALLVFFGAQWRYARSFENPWQTVINRGLVLTLIFACMVSSPLLDHAEGWFFSLMSAALFAGVDTKQKN